MYLHNPTSRRHLYHTQIVFPRSRPPDRNQIYTDARYTEIRQIERVQIPPVCGAHAVLTAAVSVKSVKVVACKTANGKSLHAEFYSKLMRIQNCNPNDTEPCIPNLKEKNTVFFGCYIFLCECVTHLVGSFLFYFILFYSFFVTDVSSCVLA